MKKLIIVFSIFFYAGILHSQWIRDSIPTTDWLYNIFYAGGNTIYVSASYGRIYKSTNRGAGWSTQQTNTLHETGAVYFINTNTGFAVTGDYQGTYGGDIFKTTNGGLNWVSKYSSSRICFRHALYFVNANTGYAGGWALGFDSALFRTIDGGETWHPYIFKGLWGVDEFSFVNSSTGYAAAYGADTNMIIKTTDGGGTWFRAYFEKGPISPDFLSVFFVNANTGWLAGMHPPGISRIMKTTNGGTNWTEQTHNHTTNWELYDMFMLNENTGWIVGDVGVIIKTTNGGVNWIAQSNPAFGRALFSVYFFGADTGLAVGMQGRMVKTLNGGGPIAVSSISTEVPASYSLSQNYPNPFNPVTKIRYALSQSSYVKLIVIDALGREIETLVNERQRAGTYAATFDASSYSSGVYYYRLTAEGFSETKKMAVIK